MAQTRLPREPTPSQLQDLQLRLRIRPRSDSWSNSKLPDAGLLEKKKIHSWPHLCSVKVGGTYGEGHKCGEACTRLSTFLYSERYATAGSTLEARTAGRAEAITAAARIKTTNT